jgi:hypothetical protein
MDKAGEWWKLQDKLNEQTSKRNQTHQVYIGQTESNNDKEQGTHPRHKTE